MNFLELCRDVARESGTLAGGSQAIVSTVDGAAGSGRAEKIIEWTRQAWISIQNEHGDWLFMRREFESALETGKARYTAADFGITRLGVWLIDDEMDWPFTLQGPSETKADEAGIAAVDYSLWRARWSRGLHDRNRPTEFAVSPIQEIVVGATPDKPYIVRGEYIVQPQVLKLDSDVPEMPAQYHRAITWEAVKLLSIADEAPVSIQTSVGEYSRVRDAMTRDLRPRVSIGFGFGRDPYPA